MTVRHGDGTLVVDDPAGDSTYIIEPIRFDLGLSRVSMVDEHLEAIAGRGPHWAAHADALLDARLTFAREAEDGPAAP